MAARGSVWPSRRLAAWLGPLLAEAPPSPVDTRRQLLMRNRFAHQLLELGAVDTIIATGLAHHHDAVDQWERIARGLAERCTAAEICRRIQLLPASAQGNQAVDKEAHAVACTATALFSNIRPEVMIEPGLLP